MADTPPTAPENEKPKTTGEKLAALGNMLLELAAEWDAGALEIAEAKKGYDDAVAGRKGDADKWAEEKRVLEQQHADALQEIKDEIAQALTDPQK